MKHHTSNSKNSRHQINQSSTIYKVCISPHQKGSLPELLVHTEDRILTAISNFILRDPKTWNCQMFKFKMCTIDPLNITVIASTKVKIKTVLGILSNKSLCRNSTWSRFLNSKTFAAGISKNQTLLDQEKLNWVQVCFISTGTASNVMLIFRKVLRVSFRSWNYLRFSIKVAIRVGTCSKQREKKTKS